MDLRPEASRAGPGRRVLTEFALLVLAGVGAGLCGSVAGLASLVSYPALLAAGLPPLTANVTNTTAMFATTVGGAVGARRELRGQGRRVAVLAGQATLGGAIGATLLLSLPEESFEAVVPGLIAFGALVLMGRDRLRAATDRWRLRRGSEQRDRPWVWGLLVVLVGVYGGYFGAAAGILMLAVLSMRAVEPFPVTNAVKNMATGFANLTATVVYVALGMVDAPAAAALALGALVGSWLGPQVVRVLPETPLRLGVGLAGLGLAAALWSGWL